METVADALIEGLQDAGIDVVFGLPGGENVQVLDAIRRKGMRFELVASESSAAFMADATARLGGRPGVCLTTLGPGAVNAVAGIANAYLERAPVLIITSQMPNELGPDYTHQVIDLSALYTPICKRSFILQAPGARETVREALRLTVDGRPGPVHLQVSNKDAAEPASGDAVATEEAAGQDERSWDIAMACDLLTQAIRPVIVVGLGMEPEGPYDALRELAEIANAPVITTPKGKGSLSDDHSLSAGTIGLTNTDPAYEILDEADCIIAVGFDVVESAKPWNYTTSLVWVATWENEKPKLEASVELVGPMQPVLQRLAETPFHTLSDWGEVRVASHREALSRWLLPSPTEGLMLPQSVLRAVRENVPRDTLLAVDVGSHKILASLDWTAYAPNRFLVSNGLSCMGCGLPYAIAASLALPGQPVVCITGDGGLAMVMGELGVLARLQTPVILVVMNDGALDLIRSQQVRAGKPVFSTEFANPDPRTVAAAYQIEAHTVSSEAECAEAVRSAVASGGPTLIEAMIDPVSYPTSPWSVARWNSMK